MTIVSSNFSHTLEPGLARAYFTFYVWPELKKVLGYKRSSRKRFERHFNKFVESYQKKETTSNDKD